MKDRPEVNPDNMKDDQLYSTGYIAELCGVQVATVRTWINEGKLPGVKIGRDLRVRRADLFKFLNSRY